MTVITSSGNAEDLSMTTVAEFEAAPGRLWDVWDDPRQLERWWGPSPYPALKSPLAPCRSCALAMRMSPHAETSAQTPSSTKNPY